MLVNAFSFQPNVSDQLGQGPQKTDGISQKHFSFIPTVKKFINKRR